MATDPRVLVAIPWRPQPGRIQAYEATVARYRDLLPDAEIVDVDTDHEPFCLAACRNKGVRLAEERGATVVVLGDADTLPERGPLLAAIEAATTSGKAHLPYTEYRSLRGDGTARFRAGVPLEDCPHLTVGVACSGVYVATPRAWWAAGGQDERFRGWGPEDMAWLVSHRVLLGSEPVRHEGRVYALSHPSALKKGPAYDASVALYHRYLDAAQQGPEAVRALQRGRGEEASVGATRALIICAGDQTRWDGHLGVPKHLAPLCGEPILHRTVRLARQYTDDVRVIVKDMGDERYKVPGSRRAAAKLDPGNHDADKFLSSRHLWSKSGRTVILYGGVFFTDSAMAQIFDPAPVEDGWHVYCRFDGSQITGAPGGENFAHVIDPEAHEAYEAALHRISRLRREGVIWRNGGWEQYRAMCGLPDDQLLTHKNYGHATVIDDWTEDLDLPGDYDMWCWQWAHADPETRPPHLGR